MDTNGQKTSATDNENAKESSELKSLRAQLRGMEILLEQNAALEKEVQRLCGELDDATMGVQKKGYLFKWREKEVYYAAKWGLRYFVLQGNKFSYFADESVGRPKRTIELNNCFVRDEGAKKAGQFCVFGVYLKGEAQGGGDDSLLLRLSSESKAEARMWIEMLQRACSLNEQVDDVSCTSAPTSPLKGGVNSSDVDGVDDWDQKIQLDTEDTPQSEKKEGPTPSNNPMVERVRSSSLVLRKSRSRSQFSRKSPLGKNAVEFFASSEMASKLKSLSKDPPKSFPAYKPMHVKAAPSPLSAETRPGEYNYRGFFNLAVIILALTHADLIVNNIAKYGWKIGLPSVTTITTSTMLMDTATIGYFLNCFGSWIASASMQFLLELTASKGLLSERVVLIANIILGTLNLILPCCWVWTNKANPGLNMIYLFQSAIMWMKLISYAHANKDLRVANKKQKELDRLNSKAGAGVGGGRSNNNSSNSLAMLGNTSRSNSTSNLVRSPSYTDNNAKPSYGEYSDSMHSLFAEISHLEPPYVMYPQNITVQNLAYFCIAPTLCYQLNYPRSKSIRKSYIATLLFRLVFVGAMVLIAVEQYIKPTLETSLDPMSKQDIPRIVERLMKLSLPSTYVWLLGFYWYFHLWLNLLAELTRFGDRLFYKDWWNAKSIDRYWRTWNMPVHHWIARHVYHPTLRMGANKLTATLIVFVVSALLHEVVISVPFRHVSVHAFLGMLGQAPLIYITKFLDKRYDNAFLGNAMFWCTFCIIGQPLGVIMYYYDLWKVANAALSAAAGATAAGAGGIVM